MLDRLSNDDLLAAIESIGTPTFVVDVGADGVFRYIGVNSANARMSGVTTEDVRGLTPVEALDPDLGAQLEQRYRTCIAADGPIQYEQRMTLRTGVIWLFTALTPLRGSDGTITRILGNSFDVTERRRVEAELSETKDFLQNVIDHIPAMIFCKEMPDLRYTLINRAAEPLFQRPDALGKDDYDLYPKAQADFFRGKDREVLNSGTPSVVEGEVIALSGDDRIVRTQKVPIRGRDGRPRYLLGVTEDVTDQVMAERRLRDAVESLRDGFMLFDRHDRVVLHNRRFLEIYFYLAPLAPLEGRTFQEMLQASRDWRRSVSPEAELDAYLSQRLAHWRSFSETPLELPLPDGGWVLVSERPTADGGVVAVHTDITAQKQAESRLVEAIESIDQGFVLFDENDRLVLWNSKLLEMFPGTAASMFRGALLRDVVRAGAASGDYQWECDSLETAVEEIQRVYASGTTEGIERQLRDGRWILFSQHVTESGYQVGLRTDITHQKQRQMQLTEVRDRLQQQTADLIRLTNDLRHARHRAEEANSAKSQFLAMISHELRTPFTGIRGMADLLAATPLNGEQGRYLDVMRRSIDRLLALLDQILDFSRIEAGRMEVEETPMSPARVIEDAATMFRPTALSKRIILDIAVAPDVPSRVLGDPQKTNQILANLIGNAVKFTERGTVTIGVTLVRAGDRDMLRWRVTDTGIGLASEQIRRLFEPFSQADNSTTRRFGGTGLGLAISKRLAEAMGGEIGVDSRIGSGSSFWFTTPARAPAAGGRAGEADIPAAGTAPGAGTGHRATGARRVLIAEDDTINQMLIETMLKQWGYDTRVVSDGIEALDALRHESFDVVLMDVNMPHLDGPGAVRVLRAEGGPPASLPVFAITADTLPEHLERYRGAGFDDVLTKPIDWKRLRSLIEATGARRIA